MAIIENFVQGTQSVTEHRTTVDCNYQRVQAVDGSVLLHLSTFGSSDRQVPGKSSQSIQLTAGAAAELVAIIRATFPGVT